MPYKPYVSGRVDYVPTPMNTKSTVTHKLFIKSLTMCNIFYSQMELFGVPRRNWHQNVRISNDNIRALESRTSHAYVLPSSDQRTH